MPISFSDRLCDFAVSLAMAGRIFTTRQLSRHPDLCGRSQPVKRASEFLRLYPTTFERLPGPVGEPHRWRLTSHARQKYGMTDRAVHGYSQRAQHWLGIGDIWLEMAFNGGRPTEWKTEPDGQFDIYCVWRNMPLLIEFQRTPITQRQWRLKWKKRLQWYSQQKWTVKPKVLLVNTTGQTEETISLPRGTLLCKDIRDLHHVVRPPR